MLSIQDAMWILMVAVAGQSIICVAAGIKPKDAWRGLVFLKIFADLTIIFTAIAMFFNLWHSLAKEIVR